MAALLEESSLGSAAARQSRRRISEHRADLVVALTGSCRVHTAINPISDVDIMERFAHIDVTDEYARWLAEDHGQEIVLDEPVELPAEESPADRGSIQG